MARQGLSKLLAKLDVYGTPVTLNFRGESNFNTSCGGLITLITNGLMAWLTLQLFHQMVTFAEPTIQTYEIGELPDPGVPSNLLDNKLIIAVMVKGFPDNKIDPRAGILELALKIKDGGNSIYSEERWQLKNCDRADLPTDVDFLQTGALSAFSNFLCLPAWTQVDGIMEQGDLTIPVVLLSKCRQQELPQGESCMDADELGKYFNGTQTLHIIQSKTFIEYLQIDRPLQSVFRGASPVLINPKYVYQDRYLLKLNEFRDIRTLFQLFAEEERMQFMTVLESDRTQDTSPEDLDYFYEAMFLRTELKQMNKRRVMGLMQFLGDAGGFHGSLFLVGAFLNYFFSGSDQALQLIKNYFIVNTATFDRAHPTKWLKNYRTGEVKAMEDVVHGSCLRYFVCKHSKKHRRMKMVIERVEKEAEQVLDLRTMLRMQSLVLALTRVTFDPLHYTLIKMQRRGGNLLDLSGQADKVETLLYGSSEDDSKEPPDEDHQIGEAMRRQLSRITAQQLSIKSQTLLKGIFPEGFQLPSRLTTVALSDTQMSMIQDFGDIGRQSVEAVLAKRQ